MLSANVGESIMAESLQQTWARDVAHRIKQIQTSWADDQEGTRKETIRREVRKALALFPEQQERAARLNALKMYFPAWGETKVQVVEVTKEVPPPEVTVEEMVERLIAAYPKLTERQRQSFSRALLTAGYRVEERVPVSVPVSSAAVEAVERVGLPAEVAEMLGLDDGRSVSPTKLAQVLPQLLKSLAELNDQAIEVRRHFEELAGAAGGQHRPRNHAPDFKLILRDFLQGSAIQTQELDSLFGTIRARVGAYIHTPAHVREKLRSELAKFLAPRAIQKAVGEGNFMVSKKALAWDKFVELWENDGYSKQNDGRFWGRTYSKAVLDALDQDGPA